MLRRSMFMLHCSIAALAAAGCYAPATPSGAYLCGENDACPSGQHCVCGQCVNADGDAACSFLVTAMLPACHDWPPADIRQAPATCVHEHQPFPLQITALMADKKTPATGFHAGVEVSSTWGDAQIVSGGPSSFQSGVGTIQVSLDRETSGAAGARLIVKAGTAQGATTTRIPVVAPVWSLDAQPALQAGGWADLYVTQGNVEQTPAGLRMYFTGGSRAGVEGIGVATSSDGKSFTMQPQPIIKAGQGALASRVANSPAAFLGSAGDVRLLFQSTGANIQVLNPDATLDLATSSDGLAFSVAPMPVLQRKGCNFCTSGITTPSIVPFPDGTPGAFELYFLSSRRDAMGGELPSVGHAVSFDDGVTWDVDPFAVVAANAQEILFSPQVVVEGSVYKMFFASVSALPKTFDVKFLCSINLPMNMTNPPVLSIGYATSSDGLYWVRSAANPVISSPMPVAPSSASLLPGKVLVDDATHALTLYYSVFQKFTSPAGQEDCLPNGIFRATRM